MKRDFTMWLSECDGKMSLPVLLQILISSYLNFSWSLNRDVPCSDEVSGKIHETLALTVDHDTAITHKFFGISDENTRENFKSIIKSK